MYSREFVKEQGVQERQVHAGGAKKYQKWLCRKSEGERITPVPSG